MSNGHIDNSEPRHTRMWCLRCGVLWFGFVVILVIWLASFLLDLGESSIHALLAVATIVLSYFLIAGRRRV